MPPPGELAGSRLVVAMHGTAPSDALLGRVRRGEIAGVILFAANVTSPAQALALTGALQRAAREGGQLPLLVCVDQEGGIVKRLPWAPPSGSARELAPRGAAAIRAEGRATGQALRAVGINCDLAPVADVPAAGSFLGSRAFSADPQATAAAASAFAQGLADAGVLAAVKHFPGIGRASVSTDDEAVHLRASRAELERDLAPFRRAIEAGVPLVMLSNASYAAFGGKPAGWSPAVANGLLRGELRFRGVTITDSLDAPAAARGWSTARTALLAAQAGVDLLLVTGSEATSEGVHARLVRAHREGVLSTRNLERSRARVAALRSRLRAA